MKNKYKMYVSTAYMVLKNDCWEWANDYDKTLKFEQKYVGDYETVAEALEEVSNWGSRWVMYPGLLIEDMDGSEVYSSCPGLMKCDCCKHEEWENITSDLRAMRDKDGKRIFPDIE